MQDLEGSDGELERESILASVQDASQFQQAKSDEQEETSSSLDKKHDTEGKDGDKAASAVSLICSEAHPDLTNYRTQYGTKIWSISLLKFLGHDL